MSPQVGDRRRRSLAAEDDDPLLQLFNVEDVDAAAPAAAASTDSAALVERGIKAMKLEPEGCGGQPTPPDDAVKTVSKKLDFTEDTARESDKVLYYQNHYSST